MIKSQLYEMGADGKLIPMVSKFDDLQPGSVLNWGGNAGFPETRFCILEVIKSARDGDVTYTAFNMDDTGKNSHLQRIEAHSIKSPDDPNLWHSQHYFIQPETVDNETVNEYRRMHEAQRTAYEDIQRKDKAEADRLEELGRKLWPSLIGECPAVIVAEFEQDDSDVVTDYFSSHTTKRIILAPSKHKRDLFPEMRKAADLLPETAHLGTGKGRFIPRVVISETFLSGGSYYHEGSRSHWHRELNQDENGREFVYLTRDAAQAHIDSKGEAYPINFDGTEVKFRWEIREEEIEHREKYSMGKGFYLSATGSHSGWQVSKDVFYQGVPRREDYIDLAKNHSHLIKSEQAPETPTEPTTGSGYQIQYERDWTWIRFPTKPADEILNTIRKAGGRFSGKRVAWYITKHVTAEEIGLPA